MDTPLVYSGKGLALTKNFEGCKLEAYQDSGGVWTIGYGHIEGVYEGMTCTQEQADTWLAEEMQDATNAVNRLVKVQLNQEEFDALVDFVYNLGAGNFASSTLLKLLNEGSISAAANEFVKWDHCGGVVVQGLLNRRLAEKKEFLS